MPNRASSSSSVDEERGGGRSSCRFARFSLLLPLPFLPSATKWIWREGGPSLLTFLLGRHEPKAGRGKQRRDFLDIFLSGDVFSRFPYFFFQGIKRSDRA